MKVSYRLVLGILLVVLTFILPSAQGATEEFVTDITVKAPENVYSESCIEEGLMDGQEEGCYWGGGCGIQFSYAVPLEVDPGWYKAIIKEGSWGTHGPSCGANTVHEHTAVHIIVPSTRGDVMVGSTDLSSAKPSYFATLEEDKIYFVLVDIDNGNNGGQVTVSLYRTFADDDHDGFQSSNYGGDDCNDLNPQVYPGAEEICDGEDNDCNGQTDEDTDFDGDGSIDCVDNDGDGFTELQGDCNDQNPNVSPCNQEYYDGIDNDCDGGVDNPENAGSCSCGGGEVGDLCQGALLIVGFWGLFRRRMRQSAS